MHTARSSAVMGKVMSGWGEVLLGRGGAVHDRKGSDIIHNTSFPLPLDRMRDTCENITLTQTSFANNSNKSNLVTPYEIPSKLIFTFCTVISPRTWRNISVIIPQIVTSLFVVAVTYNTIDGDISIDDVVLKEGACLAEGNSLPKRIYNHFLFYGIFFLNGATLHSIQRI